MITYKVLGRLNHKGRDNSYCGDSVIAFGIKDINFAKECMLRAIQSGQFYEIRIERE